MVLCLIFNSIGMLGKWHWTFDLFSHFRIQYIVILIGTGIALFLLKQKRWGLISFISALALSVNLLPYFTKKPAAAPTGSEYSLLSYNLNTANQKYDEVRNFILTTDADIILLMEVNPSWITELSPLESHYPYFIYNPRLDNFGLALYSKHPIENDSVSTLLSAGIPALQTDIHLANQTLNFISVHPLPPISRVNSLQRNLTFQKIADHIQSTPRDYQIVAGDFNCTPWSVHFKDLVAQTGLRDSSLGNGIGATWFRKLGFISIPIDHVLGSEHIAFTKKAIKGSFGSDHSAVLVTFKLSPTSK